MGERDSAGWAEVLVDLEGQRAGIEAELAGVEAEARPLALPASTGDRKAAAELAALEARRDGLARRAAVLGHAIEDAEGRRSAALLAEAGERDAERLGQLREAIGVQKALAAEVDGQLRACAGVVRRYLDHIEVLRRLGLESGRTNKLKNRTMLTGAMHLAGMSSLLPLPPVSAGHREPLEGWCGRLLDPVLAPAATPTAPWPPNPLPAVLPLAGAPAPAADPGLEPGEMRDAAGRVVLRPPPEARPDVGGRA